MPGDKDDKLILTEEQKEMIVRDGYRQGYRQLLEDVQKELIALRTRIMELHAKLEESDMSWCPRCEEWFNRFHPCFEQEPEVW